MKNNMKRAVWLGVFVTFFTAMCVSAAEPSAVGAPEPLFTPEEVQAYIPKGPSQRYRYFCSAYQMVHDGPIDSYLTDADPAEYAEFHVKLHADAALILAVPHEGYCVYPSEIGPVYPSCKNRDFLGLTIQELHKRDISAFAYVTLGWNGRYAKEHPEHTDGNTICFCSPYLDLIIAYSQEILQKYPIDGLRWDILWQNVQCRCDGCRKLYRSLFNEEIPKTWNNDNWKQREWFKNEKVAQAVRRLHDACKAIKPSVEIWHNQLNIESNNPLSAIQYVDMAYIEWGDPWGLLFHNSATPKNGFIVGKLENLGFRTMRLCLALGGHGYTYIMARHNTALPPTSEDEAEQWRRQRGWTGSSARENARSRAETLDRLAPFYEMLSKAQGYYEDGRPVYHNVGVIFCDATRYKYPNFSRERYTKLLKTLGNAYLEQSVALEYLSSDRLPKRNLSRYRLLVLLETSGLQPNELDALRTFVRDGGQLLIAGDALRHDEKGEPYEDFALASEMGIRYQSSEGVVVDKDDPWQWINYREGGGRATIDVAHSGPNTISLWPRETGHRIDRIVLARLAEFEPNPSTLGTLAGSPHLVSIEAEAFQENIPGGEIRWATGAAQQPGFSGTGYVGTPGGHDYSKTENYETLAPELRYTTAIPESDTWYVWIRQNSSSPTNDSVFIGLNGNGQTAVDFDAGGRSSARDAGTPIEIRIADDSPIRPASEIRVRQTVSAQATKGTTLIEMHRNGKNVPLLHVNSSGKGSIHYLATSDSLALLQETIDVLAGSRPVTVTPAGKQAILTRQEKQNRWILHFVDEGDCSVYINREFATPTTIVEQYPADGWTFSLKSTDTGLRITVSGDAANRLLVLQ